jgi:hypothetical protein
MTAYAITDAPPRSPETLLREHIDAMRRYANDLADILGVGSPIVRRIRTCARSNEMALARWKEASAGEAGTAETTQIGSVHERATAEGGDAQTQSPTPKGVRAAQEAADDNHE